MPLRHVQNALLVLDASLYSTKELPNFFLNDKKSNWDKRTQLFKINQNTRTIQASKVKRDERDARRKQPLSRQAY